jgi:hypothetical protein
MHILSYNITTKTKRNNDSVSTHTEHTLYSLFKKELYNGIPNVTVWRVLGKRSQLKA